MLNIIFITLKKTFSEAGDPKKVFGGLFISGGAKAKDYFEGPMGVRRILKASKMIFPKNKYQRLKFKPS